MISTLEFFSAGCPRSQISGKNLKKALKELSINIDFEPINDPKIHKAKGISNYPALKINGEILSEGEFMSLEDCISMLAKYL